METVRTLLGHTLDEILRVAVDDVSYNVRQADDRRRCALNSLLRSIKRSPSSKSAKGSAMAPASTADLATPLRFDAAVSFAAIFPANVRE
jgi:hypothetical protein